MRSFIFLLAEISKIKFEHRANKNKIENNTCAKQAIEYPTYMRCFDLFVIGLLPIHTICYKCLFLLGI